MNNMVQATVILFLVIFLAIFLLYHCYRVRGFIETALFAIIAGGIGVSVELIGVTSGGYEYVGQTLLMVSLFTSFGWIVNTYLAMHMATFILGGYESDTWCLKDILKSSVFAGVLGVIYDLFIDPVATALKVWVWSYEGPWYGIPTPNFIGWFAIITLSIVGYYFTLFYGKTRKQKIIMALLAVPMASIVIVTIMNLCHFFNIR